jgi:drug/metabolite transporter (DMT)-like permease
MSRWLYWALLAVISWGIWAILSKVIGDALSPAQSQAVSTLGMLPIIAALAFFREPPTARSGGFRPPTDATNVGDLRRLEAAATSGRKPWRGILFAVLGGMCSCLGNLPYYEVLASGVKAATVVPLTALYPVVTILLAVPLLKERLGRIQWGGIVMSLAAIYLLNVKDEEGLVSIWLFGALGAVVLWGTAGFLQKVSTNDISGARSALWFLAAFVPVGIFLVAREPLPASLSLRVWVLSAALGFTLAFGNFAILVAFARGGKASVIVPLTGLYPLVSIPIAILALGEQVGPREWGGVALAVAAVGMLSYESPAGGRDQSAHEVT